MEWYEDEQALGEAIEFLFRYSCCYGWTSFLNSTPCCDYKEFDKDIPEQLRQAIEDYLNKLPKESYCNLNKKISLLLGERYFVRKSAFSRLLCRMLADGNPCLNKEMIEYALQMQISQRIQLLETLRAS